MACFKWHLPKRSRILAPIGRSPWNRDGFDSLDSAGAAAGGRGFSAAARVQRPPGGRAWLDGIGLPAVGNACGNCSYQLLRGIAPARLALCGSRDADAGAGRNALDVLATEMMQTRMN